MCPAYLHCIYIYIYICVYIRLRLSSIWPGGCVLPKGCTFTNMPIYGISICFPLGPICIDLGYPFHMICAFSSCWFHIKTHKAKRGPHHSKSSLGGFIWTWTLVVRPVGCAILHTLQFASPLQKNCGMCSCSRSFYFILYFISFRFVCYLSSQIFQWYRVFFY